MSSYGKSDHPDLLTLPLGDILPIDRFIHTFPVTQDVAPEEDDDSIYTRRFKLRYVVYDW